MSTQLILLIIGMVILDSAFFCQVWTIWNTKHSFGLSGYAWSINLTGRLIWTIYGMLLAQWGGIVISIGQGLCGLMSIPVIYYINRNKKHGGEYIKEHFKIHFFVLRVTMIIVITSLISICTYYGIQYINGGKTFTSPINIFIISIFGSAFTGFSFLPQTIKTIKTKDTKSTSLYLCLWFIIGNTLLIAYLIVSSVIYKEKALQYILPILSTSLSVVSMVIIFIIKTNNIMKRRKEKQAS